MTAVLASPRSILGRPKKPKVVSPKSMPRMQVLTWATICAAMLSCWIAQVSSPHLIFGAIGLATLGHGLVLIRGAPRQRNQRLISALGSLAGAAVLAFELLHWNQFAGVAAVQGALATLLAAMLAMHSFISGTRRDLEFALSLSVGLVAVAAAQATSAAFVYTGGVWIVLLAISLSSHWRSQLAPARVGRPWLPSVVIATAALVVMSLAIYAVIPPAGSSSIQLLPASFVPSAGNLSGGPGGTKQFHPYPSSSGTGGGNVDAFARLAGKLNTSQRGHLPNRLIAQVRADRPGYWQSQIFDTWDGSSWTTQPQPEKILPQIQPIPTNMPLGAQLSAGGSDQPETFYLKEPADLILGTFPISAIYLSGTGVIQIGDVLRSQKVLGGGSIYTSVSNTRPWTQAQLENLPYDPSRTTAGLGNDGPKYLQLPKPYQQLKALATSISADAPSVWGKTLAINQWLASHTHYTLDAPAPPAGVDAADFFVFQSHLGFCEQISTAAVIMLRTLGIPAREAIGYVPTGHSSLSGLWSITEAGAHAWTQVWIPGAGWQAFDPTASVPPGGDFHPTSNFTAITAGLAHLFENSWSLPTAGGLVILSLGIWVIWRRPHIIDLLLMVYEWRFGRPRPGETVGDWVARIGHEHRWGNERISQLTERAHRQLYTL